MRAIAELAVKQLVLGRNEYLKVQGSIDTQIYFIESGSLRMYVLDGLEEQVIRLGYRGNIMVALDSYLTGRPSDLYIQAIKRTVVSVIPKSRFLSFLAEPGHENLWSRMLEDLALQMLEREVDILTASPRERYERVLSRSPELFQEVPHRHIASYLRMSPETLSRLKKS